MRMPNILCYHDVIDPVAGAVSGFPGEQAATYKLTPAAFERHLDAFERRGLRVGLLGDNPELALTFDDGGASSPQIAAALERRGWRGHFFVVPELIGSPGFMTAGEIRDLHRRGHLIGSHSCSHPDAIERYGAAALAHEWGASRTRLSALLGEPVRIASVPGGEFSATLLLACARSGYALVLGGRPTRKSRSIGRLDVRGRLVVSARTSLRDVLAHATADRVAWELLWAGRRWRRAGAALLSRGERVYAAFAARAAAHSRHGLLAQEGSDAGALDVERGVARELEPARDQALAQAAVLNDLFYGAGSSIGVSGRDEERDAAERDDAADGGRDGWQATRKSFDEHLRHALGEGDVEEYVAGAEQVQQRRFVRDETAQLDPVAQSQQFELGSKLVGKGAFATDDQSPARVAFAQRLEHIREQQRVLLGVETPDAEQRQIGVVAPPGSGGSAGVDVAGIDQRDVDRKDAAGMPVAFGQFTANRDHGAATGQEFPHPFEAASGALQSAAIGVAVADVGWEVLPHPEHDGTSAQQAERSQQDGGWMRSERPDDVAVVERAPHAPEEQRSGPGDAERIRQALVERQRDEVDIGRQRVATGGAVVGEAPNDGDRLDLAVQSADEARERVVAVYGAATLAVDAFGVEQNAHRDPSTPTRTTVPASLPIEPGVPATTRSVQRRFAALSRLYAALRRRPAVQNSTSLTPQNNPSLTPHHSSHPTTPEGSTEARNGHGR
jgi:peptidoglycan/xylan/chitin deacetylase (PgdA/CDA1 family)